jgi:acetyl esterase/lipase
MRPRGPVAWLLASIGGASALGMLVVTFAMFGPGAYDGVGRLGMLGTLFAPQLLAVSVLAAALSFVARRRRALLAAFLLDVTVVLSLVMGALPTVAQRIRAAKYGVPVASAALVVPEMSGHASGASATYATASDGTPLVLDVFRARGVRAGALRPAIVKVHGGDFTGGARGNLAKWTAFFNELGYDVFDVEYRKPPPARWRDEVGDVKCALGWVVANASKYGIDTRRISMMGDSAGASLAMLAAYTTNNPLLPSTCAAEPVAIRSVINLYGAAELEELYSTSRSPRYAQGALDAYIGGPPSKYSGRYDLLSPASHVKRQTPPTITFHGEADRVIPAEQAALLEEAFEEAGAHLETYLFPWADHGFDRIWGSFATQVAREKIRAFLGKYG